MGKGTANSELAFDAILDQRIFQSQQLLDIISYVPDGPFLV